MSVADGFLDRSISAHEADHLLEAEAAAKAAARADLGSGRAWHMLGLVLADMGDLPRAAAILDRALTLVPNQPKTLQLRARVEVARGRDPMAFLERAQAAAPDDPAVALSRGAARLAERNVPAALDLFARVASRFPGFVQGHVSLASLRFQLGDREHFADSYEAALVHVPNDAGLWASYATEFLGACAPARALAVVARARLARGDIPGLDAIELSALTDLGETRTAAARFIALPVAADDGPLRHTRIRHLIARGEPHAAARLAEATVAAPGGEGAWPLLATAWAMTRDPRHEWLLGDPALVGVYDLGDPPAGLADALRALHVTRIEPPEQSLRGGTQTDGDLLGREDAPVVALRSLLDSAIAAHIAQLPPPPPDASPGLAHPILSRPRGERTRFTGSWSVRLTGEGHHIDHVHPKGWFSSAYYVSLPNIEGTQGWLRLGQPPPALASGLEPIRRVEPKPGRLVLFPSILWHGTEPFPAGERLTVAFDVVPLI